MLSTLFNSKKTSVQETIHELSIDSVRFSIGERSILNNIYFSCQTGEIVGLLGRNGCGKSSLLKIIFGTLKAQNQNVRVDGKNYQCLFRNKGIAGFMAQESFLFPQMRVKKMVSLFLDNKDLENKIFTDERVQTFITKKVDQLSGGERRYLEFLLLMYQPTKFVLLDEPFAQIEPLYIKAMHKIMQEVSKYKGIIVTDHIYHNVLNISTRLVLIKDGNTFPAENEEDLIRLGYLPRKKSF